MKKLFTLMLLYPVFIFSQERYPSNEEESRLITRTLYDLIDEDNVREELEDKNWEIDYVELYYADDAEEYPYYTFTKYMYYGSYTLEIVDFSISEYGYDNSILLYTYNKSMYDYFLDYIIDKGYKKLSYDIDDGEIETSYKYNSTIIRFNEDWNDSYYEIEIYNLNDRDDRKFRYDNNLIEEYYEDALIQMRYEDYCEAYYHFYDILDIDSTNKSTLKQIDIIVENLEDFHDDLEELVITANSDTTNLSYEERIVRFDSIIEFIDSIDLRWCPYENLSEFELLPFDLDWYESYSWSNINKLKQQIIIRDVNLLLENAFELFNNKQYDLAMQLYYQVLDLDYYNEVANAQILEINELKEFNQYKKKVHSYKKLNLFEYNSLINDLDLELSDLISSNDNGAVDISFVIKFDTLGSNNSTYSFDNQDLSKKYINKIEELLIDKKDNLSPTVVKDHFIASEELIVKDIKWNTEEIKLVAKSDDNITVVDKRLYNYIKTNYIDNQIFGKFTLTNKVILENNNKESEYSLVNFNPIGGPSNAIYSFILPGIGTKRVTYGKKGNVKRNWFLFLASVSAGSKIYSNIVYDDYLLAEDQTEIKDLYNEAQLFQYIFLGTSSICATISITEFFYVLSKGFKNKKRSKYLKNMLKNGSIKVY